MNLTDRINRMNEPQTILMARRCRELKAQGIDIISLSLGEPDFKTPDIVKEAAKKAIDNDFTYYTHVSGYQELREAVARKFKRDNNLDYTAENIVVSTGAKQSIANAILSLVNPGDEVIIPTPCWVSYIELVKLAEGKQVVLETTIDSDFKLTIPQLKAAITPKTRMLVFSSPCNPTGSVYSKEELKAIAEALAPYPDIYIIADEIYEHINFIGKNESIAQFDIIKDRVITINGGSKGFAMTGWRVGYLAAALPIAKACDKIQGQLTSATCSIAQKALHAAMEINPAEIKPMRDEFLKRRDTVLKLMKEIPGLKANIPQGAFYIFPDVRYFFGKSDGKTVINSGTDLCNYLIDAAHVALVPGIAFGSDNHIRFSYATSEPLLIEALKRMKTALAELK